MEGTWFLFSVFTALLYGAQSAYVKGVVEADSRLLVTWSLFLFSLPMYLGLLVVEGFPEIQTNFYPALAVSLAVNLVAWPLFVRSVHASDLSLVMPLLAFTPIFILGVEWAILGEIPGLYGLCGILLVVVGTYVLNLKETTQGVLDPIRAVLRDKGALFMLVVAAIWSVSATVEKVAVRSSSPAAYLSVFNVCFVLLFLPILLFAVDRPFKKFGGNWILFAGAGVLTGGMAICQMIAIKLTPIVNFVISIKRAGMLVSVLLGWLFFGEKHVKYRIAGAALMVTGVVMIKL